MFPKYGLMITGFTVLSLLGTMHTGNTQEAAASLSAEQILLKADEVRNPQLDYTVMVRVTSVKPGRHTNTATYEVMIKGKNRTVIKTIFPPVDQGRVLLMLDNDLWAYLPTVSKPLRISLRERLIGEVANGDIARVNFAGDYNPEVIRTEQIGQAHYYVLNLTAKTEEVTYCRVVLWVERNSFAPFKAEFYALSGKLLKTCSYEGYTQLAGRLRPSMLVMYDPLLKGQQSTIEYGTMAVRELPEKYFTKDYMKKLNLPGL